MKDFFERAKDKVDEGISAITTKSKETIDLAKLRSQMRQLEKNKDEKLRDLGRLVYDMVRMDVYNEQKIKLFCSPIGEIDRQRVITETEIRKIQEASWSGTDDYVALCECGADLTANQKFCASCGRDSAECSIKILKQWEIQSPVQPVALESRKRPGSVENAGPSNEERIVILNTFLSYIIQ